ncbi:hypothetical protein MCEMRE249_00025 [Candidatus Nanopelagicaceae bacterium]
MNIGILGRGFGLYGYMPAFVELGHSVITLSEYKTTVSARPELRDYIDLIHFVETEELLLQSSNILTLARNPASQSSFLLENDHRLSHLFLEKPLAENERTQEMCLERLVAQNQNFSVGYLFRFCEWWLHLKELVSTSPNTSVKIVWRIPFTPSEWKNSDSRGGGLGSFYGIHFLPLILDLGLDYQVTYSNLREDFSVVSNLNYGQKLKVGIVRNQIPNFAISTTTGAKVEKLYSAESPFGAIGRKGVPDPRIPFIKGYVSLTLAHNNLERERIVEKEAIRFRERLSRG